MAISHTGHDHPATPAGRAACRKAMESGVAPASRLIRPDGSRVPAGPVRLVGVEPRRTRRAPVKPAGVGRRTFIRDEGDMADVPHVFSAAIRYAWEQDGWTVQHGNPYNNTEKRIVIDNGHGDDLVLVYKAGNHAVNAVFYNPVKQARTEKRRGYRVGEAPVVSTGLKMLKARALIEGSINDSFVVWP